MKFQSKNLKGLILCYICHLKIEIMLESLENRLFFHGEMLPRLHSCYFVFHFLFAIQLEENDHPIFLG